MHVSGFKYLINRVTKYFVTSVSTQVSTRAHAQTRPRAHADCVRQCTCVEIRMRVVSNSSVPAQQRYN